ncbi:MAG TPA: hypothetical protein VJB96_03265 [Patescibacteria group bacterium]|nr:hypothetical protein [Patescibacteria group bacterium]
MARSLSPDISPTQMRHIRESLPPQFQEAFDRATTKMMRASLDPNRRLRLKPIEKKAVTAFDEAVSKVRATNIGLRRVR